MQLSAGETYLLREYFRKRPVLKAYVFGSYTRNKPVRKSSDVDILVELDHSEPIGMKFFGYRLELEELLRRKVDLVSAAGLSVHVKPNVDNQKVLIYEKKSNSKP